ncbi:hypothetical protein DID74_00815 [Candidatus Marinamargulisbacteria bacterium SCGC AG-333-B06]|nr:hypothetical protein DID74_00815 [Candidatus Marinamargulisbacteria bacterium SCGC AG-333-B06]
MFKVIPHPKVCFRSDQHFCIVSATPLSSHQKQQLTNTIQQILPLATIDYSASSSNQDSTFSIYLNPKKPVSNPHAIVIHMKKSFAKRATFLKTHSNDLNIHIQRLTQWFLGLPLQKPPILFSNTAPSFPDWPNTLIYSFTISNFMNFFKTDSVYSDVESQPKWFWVLLTCFKFLFPNKTVAYLTSDCVFDLELVKQRYI